MRPALPLATGRLLLRRFRKGDAAAFASYRSQPQTARFQSWEAPYPLACAATFVTEMVAAEPFTPGAWFQFAVERRDDGRLIGDIGVCVDGTDRACCEIGYTLDARETGKGYAAEAIGAVLDTAFGLGKARVEAWTDRRHDRSLALLARLGFARLDAPPRRGVFKGEECEDLGHVMTAEAWTLRCPVRNSR